MLKKIAFFDIDKTLIYGDSLFSLYSYGCKKWPKYIWLSFPIAVAAVLYALGIIPRERLKDFYYKPLESFTKEDYDAFFDKYILGKKIDLSLNKLSRLKQEGYYILMATASPYAYMRLWKERGYADTVIGTNVIEIDGKYTGKIIGKNCAGEQKLKRINEFLKANDIQVDFENSCGFSDSDKDIPMLTLCKTKTRVNPNGTHSEFIPKK